MPGKKKKTFCGSLFDVEERIRAETNVQNIKYVVLSIGVNDVETKSAEQVMQQLEVVVGLLRGKHGQPKIVIGELTPRNDQKDVEVKKCNELIKQYADTNNDHIFLAKQHRLRTPDWKHYYDNKHITPYAVPIFVASLKNALRAACGIQQQNRHQQQHDRQQNGYRGGPNIRGGFDNRGRGRGNSRGRGGVGGRGGSRGGHNGQRGFDRGGRVDFRDEFEKFKLEILNIVTTLREV